MMAKPKVFLDSSGLISSMISTRVGTPMHRLLALGEGNAIDLRTSREVISDAERFARHKNAALLPRAAALVAFANLAITTEPSESTIVFCESLTGYRPDARVLAASIECGADVFVTHDKTHLLGNPKIRPPQVAVLVMSPQDCLRWCFKQWKSAL